MRFVLEKFHQDFDPVAQDHPDVRDALAGLDATVARAFHLDASRRKHKPKRGRKAGLASKREQRLKDQLKWARKKRREAEEALRKMQRGKDGRKANRIPPQFLAKVALSHPSSAARSFACAWRDLVGDGTFGVSRTSVGRIRDAFAEVCKDFCRVRVRIATASACRSSVASSGPSSAPLFCAAVLHIHDEALLRLRSSLDALLGLPSRSRSSKVQQHMAVLHMSGQHPVRWLSELDTLADKTAGTLAHSVQRVLRPLGEALAAALECPPGSQRPWLVHWLVGDGAPTNEAAAKIVLAEVRRQPLPGGLLYFMVVVKCANHQANLAVSSIVALRAATVAADSAERSGEVRKSVCGAIVRLFKFLISDYEQEFLANLQEIVLQRWTARTSSSASSLDSQRQRSLGLRSLYGGG